MSTKERLMDALLVIEEIACMEGHGRAIDKVYRIAHQAREPDCKDSHPDWEDEFEKMREHI